MIWNKDSEIMRCQKKKDTINEGFVGGIFNVSKKNKSVQQEKADAVKKAAELDMPVGYDTPTDYSPITPGVNQGEIVMPIVPNPKWIKI